MTPFLLACLQFFLLPLVKIDSQVCPLVDFHLGAEVWLRLTFQSSARRSDVGATFERCEGRTGDDLCATRRSTSRFSTCCTGQFPGFWVEFRVFRAGKEASISPAITSSRAATMGGNAESLETKRVAPRGPRGNTKRHRAGPTARL